jgi:hypothetical protein
MDHEVMDVLTALGCFSAGAVELTHEADHSSEFDELYFDVGGEG